MMHFTVEEENLICMYHNADRRRTIGKITAAMPGMDGDNLIHFYRFKKALPRHGNIPAMSMNYTM